MSFKNDKIVYSYLNSIDSGPLLTREQEEVLIKNVEVYQKQILNELIQYPYSKSELKVYLSSLDSSGESITDVSKRLDEESTKEEISHIETKFAELLRCIDSSNSQILLGILEEVSLTGTIIHGIVTEIKKKHTRIMDFESKFKDIKKYFGNETNAHICTLVISDSEDFKAWLKKEYQFTDVKLSNKLSEWKQIINEKDVISSELGTSSFVDVKEIYRKIYDLESKAQKYKNELITKNLRLVISRAKRFRDKGLEFEDLIQEGNIGLMKAVDKFDSSKKTKISTYATWWIDQSIRRAISNKGKTVRVPTHIEWMETKLTHLINKMTGTLGRPPTKEEIAEESGYDLKALYDLDTRAQHEIGIEEELSGGQSLLDILPSEEDSPSIVVEQKILREKMRQIISTLSPKMEKIVRLRYGIGELPDSEGRTLQEIANGEGITKQGVRVRECLALKELKEKAGDLIK